MYFATKYMISHTFKKYAKHKHTFTEILVYLQKTYQYIFYV